MSQASPQLKAMFERAVALRRSGRPAEALALMEQIALQQPNHPMVAQAMAAILLDARDYERAITYARVAVAGAPKVGAMHQTLATLLAATDRLEEAEKPARAALQLEPMAFGALNTMGIILARTDRQVEAATYFDRAMALHPDRIEVAANAARLMIDLGRVDEAVRLSARAVEAMPNDIEIRIARAFILNYISGVSPEEVLAQHVEVGRVIGARAAAMTQALGPALGPLTPAEAASGDSDPGRPLTIGLLSSDFSNHSVIHFVEHLIERMDRTKFRVHCYHTRAKRDRYTESVIKSADAYRQVAALDDAALVRLIRSERVDILVELGGLTARNRLPALALRAAPVQATYCGYCNTTGLEAIDYRLIDETTDPAGSERFAVERLLRLDRCFLCYRPAHQATRPAFTPDPDGRLIFGSFNAPAKISELTIDLWSSVLNAEPRAHMLIKGMGLESPAVRQTLADRLTRRGIRSDRYTIVGWTKTHAEHFNLYHRVRVALDTTPYTGTTTTCEALWMGVPVVTLMGGVHSARVSASLLSALGHPEWIARTPEDYARIALELARDEDRIRSLRDSLRPAFERSPLRDEDGHTRAFERCLLEMWREHIQHQSTGV